MTRTGTLVICVALLATPLVARADALPPELREAHTAGPSQLAAPAGAVVAPDAATLQRLLADPRGPRSVWLRAQTYAGDFEIRRPLTLAGERGAVLHGTGRGTVLRIDADDVQVENLVVRNSGRRHTTEDAGVRAHGSRIMLRNLQVQDALFGITLSACPHCVVDRCKVSRLYGGGELQGDGLKLWESSDAVVRHSVMEGARDLVVWYSRRVLLEGNTVRNSRYGSHFMYAHDSVVRDSRIVDNVVGIFVMYSSRLHVENNVLAGARGAAGVGIGFKDSDGVQVSGNWIVGNTTGMYLDGTPRSAQVPVHVDGNVMAVNDVALRLHGPSEGLFISHTDFHANGRLAEVESGGDALATRFDDNYYSDYVGYDLDADGRGDVAYQVKRLSGELTDVNPSIAFFSGTFALGLIQSIAEAMPVFSSRLLLQDPRPALRPRWLP